ncbi:MAG TPA: hypothetical protein VI548_10895 [Chitinophagaceae bacterium]|nr:hypothetical protein [Chitinophagaceae bacterium]
MNDKFKIFEEVENYLFKDGFIIINKDLNRPWGGFFVIDENQAVKFVSHFFPEENITDLQLKGKLSPKILMVAPGQRLSWQYHLRRAEIWKCIGNNIGVVTSETDVENKKQVLKTGEIVKLKQGLRHRLLGLDDWGMVAEIWQHTDTNNPSDEEDIIRLQDDYSRV